MNTLLDHLVVAAASLEQGVQWCEATLGVVPGPGGRHAQMGTHNRLLRIDGPGFAQAYLEILAIDPEAADPGRPRWFGLDDPALQARLAHGPSLVQAVLRTPNIEMMRWGLINVGVMPGEPLALERPAAQGPLRWRILVRPDGALALGGALPPLIQWSGPHPTEAMAPSPVQIEAAAFGGLPPRVRELLRLKGPGCDPAPDAPALAVQLQTPRGPVRLSTPLPALSA